MKYDSSQSGLRKNEINITVITLHNVKRTDITKTLFFYSLLNVDNLQIYNSGSEAATRGVL